MPVFKSSRKVQEYGSSLALTLPAMFVKVNEIEKGSVMDIMYGLEGVMVISSVGDIEAIKKCLKAIIDKLENKVENDKWIGGGDARSRE